MCTSREPSLLKTELAPPAAPPRLLASPHPLLYHSAPALVPLRQRVHCKPSPQMPRQGRVPLHIDPKIQNIIDLTDIPDCYRGHESNQSRGKCTCGAGWNLLRQGPYAKLWRAGELPYGTCTPCGTNVCDGSGKRRVRTVCPCGAKGCGGTKYKADPKAPRLRQRCPKSNVDRRDCKLGCDSCGARICPRMKVQKYQCKCGGPGCGKGLCEESKLVKARCNCGSDGCGIGLCPRTGSQLHRCTCRRPECGNGLCDVSSVSRNICDCEGDRCGASLCPKTRKPEWVCDCRRRECGSALCPRTGTRIGRCKCGDAKCGRQVAAAILNRFFPPARRRGDGYDFYTVSEADAEAFFGMSVDDVLNYLVATYPGSAAETRRLWSLGLLHVDHIEPCALVVERMGPFVEKGEATEAFKYVNRLENLQLMRGARNSAKCDDFPRSTRDALAQRAALKPSGAMTPTKFQGWVADVRLDVRDGNFEIGDPARFKRDRAPRRAPAAAPKRRRAPPSKPTRSRPAPAASAKRGRRG